MSSRFLVNPEGDLLFPFHISIHAQGKTAGELRIELATTLIEKGFLYHPSIAIGIGEAPVRRVTVEGSVGTAGTFSISEPISVLDALAKAGGLTEDAGSRVFISRPAPEKPEESSIEELQVSPASLRPLAGGETVTVPEAPKVRITGRVAHPGTVRLNGFASVLRVLDQAGVSPADDQDVFIYRNNPNRVRIEIPVSLSAIRAHESEDVPLLNDDIVLVTAPENPAAPYDNAMMRLMQRIVPAGGAR
jgi:polysaccharide export outer membrane protein